MKLSGETVTPDPVNNYEFHYCIFIPSKSLGPHNPSIYAFMELSFDALCFLLTLIRPFLGASGIRQWGKSLWMNLARNGALYFGVIFSVNLGWAVMILHAPGSIRGALAAPSAMAMATFISRITLSLRYAVYGNDLTEVTRPLAHGAAKTGETNDEIYPLDRMSAKRRPNPSPYSPAVDIDTHYLEGVDYSHDSGYGRGRSYSGHYTGYSGPSPTSSQEGHARTLQTQQSINGINVEHNVVIMRD